jgi:hypothetical protein
MNDACRGHGGTNELPHVVPLILVGTAGVHARLFCDFCLSFIVIVDEDGKTSRSTLLHSVEEVVNGDGDTGKGGMKLYSVHCQMSSIIGQISNFFHRVTVGRSPHNESSGREQV